jgi:serine/threonine protein kinase
MAADPPRADEPAANRTDPHLPDPRDLPLGGVFAGRYKVREKLGEGGMGTVYVADQQEPVSRRVDLKVVKADVSTATLLARFEQERQALALMDHPHIAKVLDAGVAGGTPYFVMELIKGVPITKYCDEARLTPRQRLELFIPVCQAVQHAHQKGVIHRDLKPSNILVGLYDGRPVPKVIDFGVAKVTGPKLGEHSVYTEVGQVVGTLEYMSPEQAELNNLDIDTRTDVYALGVLLYELLTGTVPFSREELQAAGAAEMLRIIEEVEPHKPSTLNNLAAAFLNAGAVDEAIRLFVQVAQAQEKKLGADHPHTLATMGNLAGAYWGQGEEARGRPPRHPGHARQPRRGVQGRWQVAEGHQILRAGQAGPREEAGSRPPLHLEHTTQPRLGIPRRRRGGRGHPAVRAGQGCHGEEARGRPPRHPLHAPQPRRRILASQKTRQVRPAI